MTQKIVNLNGLTPGQKYVLRIKSIANDGSLSQWSQSIPFTAIKDIDPPGTPTSASLNFTTPSLIADWETQIAKQSKDFKTFKVTVFAPSKTSSATYYSDSPFTLTFDENVKIFGSPQPVISLAIQSQDNYGNISDPLVPNSASNASPTETPVVLATGILNGFSASWASVSSSFIDYSFTEVYYSSASSFSASLGTLVWRGQGTYAEYSGLFSSGNIVYVKARHFDVFGQASSDSNAASAVLLSPIVVSTTPPSNASGLTVSASNDGGATGFGGHLAASWNPSTASNVRGYRLRVRQADEPYYQYENSASNVTLYHIGGLVPGENYEVAIAAYDEFNNTSSYTLANSYAIIPYAASVAESIIITSASNSTNVAITGTTVSASMVGMTILGYGLLGGATVTASFATGSLTISVPTFTTISGSAASLTYGVSNLTSYISAGTSSFMKFGTGVKGTQSGLYIDDNNYWYNSGNLRVGSTTSSLRWDGTALWLSGNINAQGGSFSGNVQLSGVGSLYAASTGGGSVVINSNGITAYNSSGLNTFILSGITGLIGASAGIIGGWTISSASLYAGTSGSTVGLAIPSSSTDISIWAGSANKISAPFRVAANGAASMSNAYVSGSIIFTAGYVGGWTVDSTSLYNSSVGFYAPTSPALTEIAIFAGSSVASRATAPFRVSYNGAASMTNAYVSGTVIASTGSIGGWTLAATQLSAGTAATEVGISTGVTSFWAGSTSLAAPFRVTNTGALTATSGQIGGFTIGPTNLYISTGTSGNTVSVYMNATASTSASGNYPFGTYVNNFSGTASTFSYVRTMLAYNASITTMNNLSQKVTWIKIGSGSPTRTYESAINLFADIPTKYISESGASVGFNNAYDGWTGMVWRNSASSGVSSIGNYTYLVNSPWGDTHLDADAGNIFLTPQVSVNIGTGGTVGTPATATALNFDVPAAGGTANTNIYYLLGPDGRYRYNIRQISSSLKTKNLIGNYEITKNDFMSIKPRLFSWKEDVENRPRGGFILEEISSIGSMRPFVNLDPSGEDQSLDYGGMVAMLVNVVQEQQKQIESLTASVSFLVNK